MEPSILEKSRSFLTLTSLPFWYCYCHHPPPPHCLLSLSGCGHWGCKRNTLCPGRGPAPVVLKALRAETTSLGTAQGIADSHTVPASGAFGAKAPGPGSQAWSPHFPSVADTAACLGRDPPTPPTHPCRQHSGGKFWSSLHLRQ